MRFNGISKSYIKVLKGRKRPPFAPLARNLLTIPYRPGGFLQNTQTNTRTIEVPILMTSTNITDLQKLKEDLAEWLVTNQPEELIFDDEPDRAYYAVVDGSLDIEELVYVGKGTITFICPDPYKYGPEKTLDFTDDNASLNYLGTVESYPVIQTNITKATTFLSISNQDDYIMVGQPSNTDDTPTNPYDSVMYDGMSTTVGWAESAIPLDGGVKAGTISANGSVFLASDYGAGTEWHGPALQKSTSEQVQDFEIEVTCYFETTTAAQAGRLEVYLLDINNKVIGKVAIKDYTDGLELTMPEIIVKNDTKSKTILEREAADDFNDFYGMLRLKRIGKEFWASIIRVDPVTNENISSKERYFMDVNSEFQSMLSSVVVHFGASGTYSTPATNQIHEISVLKYNTLTDNQVPYIAQPGDVIVFDHQRNVITRNGESILYEKDFASSFFSLKKGLNELSVQPSDTATAQLVFREKFL